jgi:hypothetical protein
MGVMDGSGLQPTARALLDDMRALAEKRDEAALWELLAKAPKSTQQIVELETEGVRIRDPSRWRNRPRRKGAAGSNRHERG